MLDAAKEVGLTVMRTWAFNDGTIKWEDAGPNNEVRKDNWNPIQTQPGEQCWQNRMSIREACHWPLVGRPPPPLRAPALMI